MSKWRPGTLKYFRKKNSFSFKNVLSDTSLVCNKYLNVRGHFLILKCLTCVIFVCKPLSFIVNYSCTYLNFNYQPHIVKNHTTPKNISTITLKLRMHYSLTWLLPCWGWVATFSCETTKKFCMLLPSSEPHTCFHYSC